MMPTDLQQSMQGLFMHPEEAPKSIFSSQEERQEKVRIDSYIQRAEL